MFARSFSYQTSLSKEALKTRLVGNHLCIRDLDFEVLETCESLSIVPHATREEELRALPETIIELNEYRGKTRVKITSKMRQMDIGGPMVIMTVCGLMLIASVTLLFLGEKMHAGTILAIDAMIYLALRLRLEKSYFDYMRKVWSHVLNAGYYVSGTSQEALR